ncbi:unnamed protein product [Symbiodinium microadriaticum]|nr:unnamed protein product [Symbiodinium microadriaticum]
MAYLTKEEEDDRKYEDKEELSPWGKPDDEDPETRVYGWRDGTPLTRPDVSEIIRSEPRAQAEYRSLKKQGSHKRAPPEADPLEGLPPTWQAVFSAAPNAAPQAAWKEYSSKKRKTESTKKKPEVRVDIQLDWESRENETPEEEIARIKPEIERLSKAIRDNAEAKAWKQKIAEATKHLKEGEKASKQVLRAFEIASYNKAVASGQLRSSDMYFQFLTQDTAKDAETQVTTLERSCALMDKTMDLLKGHIKKLEEVAAESIPAEESHEKDLLSPSPSLGKTPGPLSPSPGFLGRSPGPMASPGPAAARLRALKVPPVSPSLRD